MKSIESGLYIIFVKFEFFVHFNWGRFRLREFEEIKHVNLNWQYGIEKNGNFLKDGSQMKSMMMDRTG